MLLRNALYLRSILFHFFYNLLLYPEKLCGTMMHPREAIKQVIHLPKYVYMAG